MRKSVLAAIAAIATLTLLSCATARGGDGLTLQEAIQRSAYDVAGNLPAGTRLAVVAFESESDGLSDFIMEELTRAIMRHGIEVADRRNLDLAFMELNFQMTGYVRDETALSIGRFLGAQFVVTGQFLDLGDARRLSADAINVETATRQNSTAYDVRNDAALRNMVEALSRGTTRRAVDF